MKRPDPHIPHEVAAALGFYVYALRDPRDGRIFYVGKGKGDRINAHSREAGKNPTAEQAKLKRLNEIEAAGQQLELLFLRTGISDEATAFAVEQAVIDAFAADHHGLTNLVKGHQSGEHGLATLTVTIARHGSRPAPAIPFPLVMVKINRGWRPDMTQEEIYEQTRGYWKIAESVRERARYALGIGFGVTYGAYRIDSWFPSPKPGEIGRWGFSGAPAPELQHVIGRHVRATFSVGSQNPYRKFLDGYPGERNEGTNTSKSAGDSATPGE